MSYSSGSARFHLSRKHFGVADYFAVGVACSQPFTYLV